MDKEKLNILQNELKIKLSKAESFDEAIQLCIELHALLHLSKMSCIKISTYEDDLWNGITESTFRIMPLKKDSTIAWCLWHLSRIEDITTNI